MKITRRSKPGKPVRRLDVSALQEALDDGSVLVKIALVGWDGGEQHYDLDAQGLHIYVRLMPDEEEVISRFGAMGGGIGTGVWVIPPIGAEVLVVFPDGDFHGESTIVGVLSSGAMPDGVAPNTVVIAEAQVLVHDGSGGAEPLITKSQFDAHKHPSGAGPTGPPDNAPTSGTTVLKGK